MIEFQYAALNEAGQLVEGRVQAASQDVAIAAVQERRWVLLSLKEAPAGVAATAVVKSRKRKQRVAIWELAFLAEQLATLLEGGLPLMRALSMQQGQARNPRLAEALGVVSRELAGGKSLAACVAAHEDVFPRLWPAMVRIGENSGALPRMLNQIAAFHEMQEDIKSRVTSALMYPVILLCLSMAVLAFFVVRVVPSFAEIFESYGTKIPPLTAAVIYGAKAVKDHIALIVAVAALGWFFADFWLSTRSGSTFVEKRARSLPWIGDFFVAFHTQRFVSALALLLSSGVNVVRAFEVLADLFVDQPGIRHAILSAQGLVVEGKSMSAALARSAMFPTLVTDMAATGEESGKLVEMLGACNRYYLKRMDQFLKRFSAVVDPVLVILVGGVVVVIVMAIMLPIMSLTKVH